MNSSSTVSAELGLRLVVPQQAIVPLMASLFYSREDPYAVRIAFHVGLDEPVEWIFARDLLSMGIEDREGLGDVQVWPSAGSEGGTPNSVLNLELSSPFGQAHFEAPVKEISDFLSRTYQIVPVGHESDHVDVEAELTDLLRQAS
jgi:Streptomyces sporulation and cell division protein, SsgA